MLLGKRPRPPMRRTTSLTEFSADVGAALEAAMPQPPAILQEQDAAAVAAIAASAQQYYWPPGAVPMEGVTVPPPMPVPVPVVAPAVDHLQPPGAAATAVSHQHQQQLHQHQMPLPLINPQQNLMDVRYYGSGTAAPMVSPRRHRRNSADFQLDTAHFLKACGLCNRRLKPGKDIYMYRGEIAFCSSECRQQQMNFDERKVKKCSLTSIKKDHPQAASAASATASTNSEPSATNGVAAA